MPKAVEWILSVYEQIGGLDELLQMSIIEVIRLDCKNDSAHRVCVYKPVILIPPDADGLKGSVYSVHLRATECLFTCCQV